MGNRAGSSPVTRTKKTVRTFARAVFFITGLEPEKVSAFKKRFSESFLAGSARAVPHAKRGVTRADSMRAQRSRRSSPLIRTKSERVALAALFDFASHFKRT